ncbi:hypothetical protein EOM60_01280 [Candidatus Saccharibacteria bacterium]|nr:hypothetical protein [Candidatus Saccharibacteria bacterium]
MKSISAVFTNLDPLPGSTPEDQLAPALDVVYLIAGLVAIIVIIVAGIKYTSSRGDSGKVEEAKKTILYAVIGLAVTFFAFVITRFVAGRF